MHYVRVKLYFVKPLYPTLVQAADADRDGMVSGEEFNKMIDMATAAQKRYTTTSGHCIVVVVVVAVVAIVVFVVVVVIVVVF